jgi:DNA primase
MSVLQNLIAKDFTLIGSESARYIRTAEHMSLVLDVERDVFFWNSRNIVGDALTWLTQVKNMSFSEARQLLQDQPKYSTTVVYTINTEEGKQDVVVYPELVNIFWEKGLGVDQRTYWYNRMLTNSTIDRFKLGYNDGWSTVPIFIDGTFRNFQCRMDDPKKLRHWYKGVGPLLFNSDLLNVTDYVLITEGTIDAIFLSQLGYPAVSHNTGAGWMNNWHRYFTLQADIVYIADHDAPGIDAARKVSRNLGADRVRVVVFNGYPDKYDTIDFFRNGGTKESFDNLLEGAKPIYYYEGA